MSTAYDVVAYPTIVHQTVHPERLAIAAKLAGLDPVPMDEARVLDIGGGTCLSLIAFAAQYPGAEAHGFDLAASAIARGCELAGPELTNVHLSVDDITLAHERYAAGSFDYVIAHGVYAWVPEPVRAALMRLVAHVLSERGVAFISYNALPGGHVRMILREMVLHAVAGLSDPEERVAGAYAFLRAYAEDGAEDGDDPLKTGLRRHAASMASRPPSVLFHDEMGECYAPQSLQQVVSAAEGVGLRWLTDGGRNRGFDGFLTDDADLASDSDETVLRTAQTRDYNTLAFFRASLFVRNGALLVRKLDPARIDDCWVSAKLKPLGNGEFGHGADRFVIADPDFAGRLEALSTAWPARRPVREIAFEDDQRRALLGMQREWFSTLHLDIEPFAIKLGERPCTAPWIRGMLARGEAEIISLGLRTMRIDQPALRALLIAADGSRTVAELEALDHGMPSHEVSGALAAAVERALLVR